MEGAKKCKGIEKHGSQKTWNELNKNHRMSSTKIIEKTKKNME